MKKVLVTGAHGMLGQDLCPILKNEGYEVVETDVQNLDITKPNMVNRVLEEENLDIVIHCAGYSNVDKAEEEKEIAKKINSFGTENIAKICGKNDITLVYISSDYVFGENADKKRTTPLIWCII
mgnify:CR=1 FL=1